MKQGWFNKDGLKEHNMNKVALVTGGSSGIGLQIALDLADQGYKVIALTQSYSKLIDMEQIYLNIIFKKCDITKSKDISSVFTFIAETFNTLDVLVNSAGIIKTGNIETLSIDDWNEMFEVNVTSVFYIIKYFLPLMQFKDSSIINISSISANLPSKSLGYSVCKSALDMLTKSSAKELSHSGIRINSVDCGLVDTGFQIHNGIMGSDEYDLLLSTERVNYPLGIGAAKDISELVQFLISPKAKWITGSCYTIDGGRSVNI